MEALQLDLEAKDQEAERLRQQAELDRARAQRVVEELQTQAAQLRQQAVTPLMELGSLQQQMREKQETWDRQKTELESQADRMMELLRGMGILAGSGGGGGRSAERSEDGGGLEGLGSSLPSYVRPSDYHKARADYGLTAPDAQALQIKELSLLLAEARQQTETYRRQLAARSLAPEELMRDIKRLKADNQRLVALLASVPEYRSLAAEVAAESGVHYVPLEECLMVRGLVEDLHPQLLDRPVQDVTGGDLAGVGRRRDPDGTDPTLTLVLDEQYHWVPRRALETGAALMRRLMPALPMSQLLTLVAELNKVWRDRERQRLAEVAAAHQEELRKLQQTFQQRAPYEAVVAGHKINDLKRRMRAQAAQAAAATAAAKKEKQRAEDDSKVMLHAGLSSIQDLSKQVATLVKRNKKLATKAAKQRTIAAAATAAAASARADPLCSASLDRLLKPDTNGPDSSSDPQHPQHQQQAATRPPEAPGAAAGYTSEGPPGGAGYGPPYTDAPEMYNMYPYGDYTVQQQTVGLGGWNAAADPHGSGMVGSVLPPGFGPSAAAAADVTTAPSWRPAEASMPPPSGASTPTRHVGAGPPGPTGGASTQAVAAAPPLTEVQLGSSLRGLTISAPGVVTVAAPQTGAVGEAGTSGGGLGTTVEFSTASLAEWRQSQAGGAAAGGGGWTASVSSSGDGRSSPVAVRVHLGGSPRGAGTGAGTGTRGGSVDGVVTGAAVGGAAGATGQVRGAPVRVRVRFPRHDVTISQPV